MTTREREILERLKGRYASDNAALPSEADQAATEPTPAEEVKAVTTALAEAAKKGNENAKMALEGLRVAAGIALKVLSSGAA